tara:strand:- start:1601 stop:2134 length:534 start_codon:yes stop_codon:yes gene_type:complete
MHKFWEKVEHWNAKLITPAILALIYIITVELFFHHYAEEHHTHIAILSAFVLIVFIIDVIFLYIKSENWKDFLKKYWLDVVAIFPFSFAIQGVSKVSSLVLRAGTLALGQEIVHTGLEARKGISAAARTGRIARIIRIIARSLRIVTKTRLGKHVTHKHHMEKRGKKVKKKSVKKKK